MAIVKNILLSLLLALILLPALMPGCTDTAQQIQANVDEQKVFSVANLYAEPISPQPDETFVFNMTVTNSGDKQAIYNAVLSIIELVGENELEVAKLMKSITVAAGGSELLTFEKLYLPEGIYNAVIDNLVIIFKVSCT
jgi:hypothetical protein